jgi:hypothetical protein
VKADWLLQSIYQLATFLQCKIQTYFTIFERKSKLVLGGTFIVLQNKALAFFVCFVIQRYQERTITLMAARVTQLVSVLDF